MSGIIVPMARPVKRPYRSDRRVAAATATRQRIRDAATELFVERGYAATSLREVVERAGVGERTLYDAFPNKVALFAHALDVAIVGDEVEVAVADRQEMLDAVAEPDPQQAMDSYLAYSVGLLERAGPLIMVMHAAADADEQMRAMTDAGATETLELHRRFARSLEARGALAPGVDHAAAADILYALTSPHLHQLLRRDRAWSLERYRAWLDATVAQQVTALPAEGTPGPGAT
jgi:AcrR family transcriptional regulator